MEGFSFEAEGRGRLGEDSEELEEEEGERDLRLPFAVDDCCCSLSCSIRCTLTRCCYNILERVRFDSERKRRGGSGV